MPIQTDYTLIYKRKPIGSSYGYFISKSVSVGKGAFITGGLDVWSFGTTNNLINNPELLTNEINFQTKENFNGRTLISGNGTDTNTIIIGGLRKGDLRSSKQAFYSAYLFDRSLDEQEIKSFIREYMDPDYYLPSEIVTPDCYYDFNQGSNDDKNREIIKDFSGNGNDAKTYNVAWSKMSGYGGYDYLIPSPFVGRFEYDKIGDNKFIFHSILYNGTYLFDNILSGNYTKGGKLKFKISNIPTDIPNSKFYIVINSDQIILLDNITQDGEYEVNIPSDATGSLAIRFAGLKTDSNIEGLTFEFIPNYPGALVLDGVDDYLYTENIEKLYRTAFVKFKRVSQNNKWAYIFDSKDLNNLRNYIGYNSLGELKTTGDNYKIYDDLLVAKLAMEGNSTAKFKIGVNIAGTEFCNMAIYKFLGFKDELTEEQINYVIEKYNLLDGVDEIEVS